MQIPRFTVLCSAFLLISLLFLGYQPVSGTEIPGIVSGTVTGVDPEGVIGRYDDFTVENSPTVGMGLFPTVILDPELASEDALAPKMTLAPVSSGPITVMISPFSGILNGQQTYLIAGYLNGPRSGATLSVGRKETADSDFNEVETIKADENGLFVWAAPADMAAGLFRVTASTSSETAVSNGIRFVADTGVSSDPVIKPVVSPVESATQIPSGTKPFSTKVQQTDEDDSDSQQSPKMTSMRISSSTTTPAVGDEVIITGRLTDSDGKGVDGATINLDESGYPGAQQAEPLSTTSTDSDGRFEFSITVKFANVVGLYAHFDGDERYYRSESNSLMFSSL